jgi:hypothetical protein
MYLATQIVLQMNLKHVSYRLPIESIKAIQQGAKANKVTQTAFISAMIDKHHVSSGLQFAAKVNKSKTPKLATGGTFDTAIIPDADMMMLKNLGISTAFGIGGYLLAGEVRKQLQKDEDKGTQMLVGLAVGLVSLLVLSEKK